MVRSFPPVADKNAKLLVLGSMPGEASLRAGQYYGHPRNAFWPIMGALFGAAPALPYPQRLLALQAAGIALWDTLQACTRPGSLDSAITNETPNNFSEFLATHPSITHIFFNGATAESTFRRHALPLLPSPHPTLTRLPSTSPAHASLGFAAKLAAWQVIRTI